MTIKTFAALLLATGLMAACTSPNTNTKSDIVQTPCEDPRPQICTMEYRPVCATLDSGELKTFGSGCSACGDALVQQHRPGACEGE